MTRGLARLLSKHKVHDDLPPNAPITIVDCLAPDAKEKIDADANVQLVAGSWSGMMAALDGEIVGPVLDRITETNKLGHGRCPRSLATPLRHTKHHGLHGLAEGHLKTGGSADELRDQIKDAGLDVDVFAWNEDKLNPFYVGTMQFLYTMVGFITFILATVIVFSIFNSATITVIERSKRSV